MKIVIRAVLFLVIVSIGMVQYHGDTFTAYLFGALLGYLWGMIVQELEHVK